VSTALSKKCSESIGIGGIPDQVVPPGERVGVLARAAGKGIRHQVNALVSVDHCGVVEARHL
jgi:hypothetical protein